MTALELALAPVRPARGDQPANRACLRCATAFWSEGFGERICRRCKAHSSWRSSVSEGLGTGRRNGSR